MSEEKDRHLNREEMDKAKTSRFFKTKIDILNTAATRTPFVNNAIAKTVITVPTTNSHTANQLHLITNEKDHINFFNGTFSYSLDRQ